jgi:hypothetical protein
MFSSNILPGPGRDVGEKQRWLPQRPCGQRGGGDRLLQHDVAAKRQRYYRLIREDQRNGATDWCSEGPESEWKEQVDNESPKEKQLSGMFHLGCRSLWLRWVRMDRTGFSQPRLRHSIPGKDVWHSWSRSETKWFIKKMDLVDSEELARLPKLGVAAHRTNTGPTATCGIFGGSSSCATALSMSCQVREDGGKRQGRPTTPSRSADQITRAIMAVLNEYFEEQRMFFPT